MRVKNMGTNDEYIRRKDVAEMLESAAIISNGEYSGYCTEDVNLDSIPTANVALVRRGEWLPPVIGKYGCLCSACHAQADNDSNYCPNCGAIMDGGEGNGAR